MAYIGRGLDKLSNVDVLDVITFTSSAGPYNILKGGVAFIPSAIQNLLIEVDGVIQASTSYTITGSTITFGVSMSSSSTMNSFIHFGMGVTMTPADGTVSTVKIVDDAVTTAKILDANVTNAKTSFTPGLTIKGDGSSADGKLTLNCSQNTHGVHLQSPTHASAQTYTLTLPTTPPATDKFIQTNSSGQLAFASVTEYDDNQVQSNIAMLGFKVATNGSLVKYNLVKQTIDEFNDTSGVDSGATSNDVRSDSAPYYYVGGTNISPTITQDADDTGTDGIYSWYKWTDTGATGSYQTDTAQNYDILVIAGGGGGGYGEGGGGGGAGGFKYYSQKTDVGTSSTTITIGAGGAGGVSSGDGTNGVNSSFGSLIATGGGGGGGFNRIGIVGGSGGAGGGRSNYAGAAGTSNQGYAGGNSAPGAGTSDDTGGGGGGASAVGTAGANTGPGGNGGAGYIEGTSTVYDWFAADGSTETFDIDGTDDGYAGGGGGGSQIGAAGTATQGGGNGGVVATANTGGGGGGHQGTGTDGFLGGSGVIILRRETSITTVGGNMTLQSTDSTASSSPTYGEFVTLIEDAYGTATLNTDIKGYISRDSGTTFTEGVLTDEGTWGTNKKILGFHDLTISGAAGTSMCYKITTHNQVATSKETRVYATSIGWR